MNDDEPEWYKWAIIFTFGLLILCIVCALARADETLTFSLKAPCFNGLPCDSFVVSDSGWVRPAETDTLRDLKEIRIYGRVFDEPDTVLLGSFAAQPCSSYTFAITVASGHTGVILPRAADNWGNLSCLGDSYVFATKALDFQPGLHAEYFDNEDLTNLVKTRTDPNVDFDWGYGSPDPLVGPDTFSACWTGYIVPPLDGIYWFGTLAEDGTKLWVGPNWLISDFGVNVEHEGGSLCTLSAGLRYPITLEYMAHNGHASCHLEWIPPGGAKEIIPAAALSH